MAQLVGLPKLSPTMEEGVLAKWHKQEGDAVSPGEVIAEVETDKANMDFVLEDEGVLLRLLVGEGETVKLGAPVAIIGERGEDVTALVAQARGAGSTPAPVAAPAPAPVAAPAPITLPVPAVAAGGRFLASPLSRKIAIEHGLDLRGVAGSGPGGRIVERDVRALIAGDMSLPAAPAPAAPAPAASPPATPAPHTSTPPFAPPATGADFTDRPLSMMRKTIARRLVEAKSTVPHFYLTATCDAAPLLRFRAELNSLLAEGERVSVNDIIVKATALALRRVPQANASFLGDAIRQHARVHVGVAVSLEDGLVTPVVRDADRKGLATVAGELRELATRARARKLTPDEMSGSTATVSNLGMFGIDHFAAIINPPDGVILAVGAIKKVPVVGPNDTIIAGQRMALTLSCDHRVVDGALGARLLAELVKLLEQPAALAL